MCVCLKHMELENEETDHRSGEINVMYGWVLKLAQALSLVLVFSTYVG